MFTVAGFIALPQLLGVPGLWLAIPMAELLTLVIIVAVAAIGRRPA